MKLYTEEQVRQAFVNGWMASMTRDGHMTDHAREFVDSIAPVELPSDEEIENYSRLYGIGFPLIKIGAKWAIDKIKNQQ